MSPKNVKIDTIDAKIVSLLAEDGRMSCAEIARKIGEVTERAVRYRIKRLTETGIVSIKPVVNPALLGYVVIADVFIEVEPGYIQEVAQKLASIECVTYVACSIGERDVSIQIAARTNSDVYSFVTGTVAILPGVRKTTTSIVPVILKDLYTWPIPVEAISGN
jgi:Lrp/AsnC family transcriptional regulator for asnA, asnC and gidA